MTTTELREAHDQLFSDLEAARCEITRLKLRIADLEAENAFFQARPAYDSVPLKTAGTATVERDK